MKDEIPQLQATDMPDIKSFTREELAAVPFDKWRLFCCIQECKCFIHVRDYGIWPLLAAWGGRRWINVRIQIYFCGKHNKQYKGIPWDKVPFKDRSTDEIRKTIMEPQKKVND